MGSITERRRGNGSIAYRAAVVIRRDGKRHTFTQTFDREQAAKRWISKKERELAAPGGLERATTPAATLGDAIDRYLSESRTAVGKTKAQVLETIKGCDLASLPCAKITSDTLVQFAHEMSEGRKPQTVGNYLSHLSAIFAIARPAWGLPLDRQAMQDAMIVARRMGLISKSAKRERRPSVEEMDKLMSHFADRHLRGRSLPMHHVCAFALFSSRRQEEIVRIRWDDLEADHSRVLVREMKHPAEKIGNDIWCELTPEALSIALAQPRAPDEMRVFPFSTDAVSASFTRACKLLGIDDLHFHDLRHEGVSRLFEIGRTIPQAASVSGHRSRQSLQRYSHLRTTGDKWLDWAWLPRITLASHSR